MKDYSEILKSLAAPPAVETRQTASPAPREKPAVQAEEDLPACGSPHCAGCYDVGDGRKIHPPKAGMNHAEEEAAPLRRVLVVCWHCAGKRTCDCLACGRDGGECAWCRGTGEVSMWIQ
jgi:hypothetical protein